jgi:hypothetical protein
MTETGPGKRENVAGSFPKPSGGKQQKGGLLFFIVSFSRGVLLLFTY